MLGQTRIKRTPHLNQDYWVLDLVGRALEMYRQPIADAAAPFGWRHAHREVFDAVARVTPLAAPGSSAAVSQLLP